MRYAIIEDGAPVEVFPGKPFTATALVEVLPPAPAEGEEPGEPTSELQAFTVIGQWCDALTPEELAAFGVKTVIPAPAAAEGDQIASTELVVDGARVVELATYEAATPPHLVVPGAVDMRQARIKLFREGVLDVVDAMIAASEDPEVSIEWRFAKEVRRDHPFINGVQLLLQKTNPEMDLWFVEASQIGPMGAG